jgi:hypothetical protein
MDQLGAGICFERISVQMHKLLKLVNMKAQIRRISFLLLVIFFSAMGINASAATPGVITHEVPSREVIAHMTKEQKEARMEEMRARVQEIKAMDKSTLTREQRKALRAELKSMNKEAHAMGYAGVYISVAGLIIIILLLILILR